MKNLLIILGSILLLSTNLFSSWEISTETGYAKKIYSDVKIPGNSGTEFSLTKDFQTDPIFCYRINIYKSLTNKSSLSFLYAPLTFNSEGTLTKNINFNNETFYNGDKVSAKYRFDSYRLSYIYTIIKNQKTEFALGGTIKVRDAEITLNNNTLKSSKKNTGVVPLIFFKYKKYLFDNFSARIQGDALAAPQGRAEDVLFAIDYDLTNKTSFTLGYRILEGGADNDEVYNFTFVQYFIAAINYKL